MDSSSERSSCRISFFIDGREMSSEDVSMVDVKLELRADSRKWHCRMMIRDSTSEAARERKTRTLRERSPLMTLSRKLSLMMRMRALHWRAIRAVLVGSSAVNTEDSFGKLSLE